MAPNDGHSFGVFVLVTADITEAPTTPESQVSTPAPEQEIIGDVQPPASDAGAQESVDAAAPEAPSTPEAEYEAYVKEADKESGESAPEAEKAPEAPQQPAIDPQVYEYAKNGYATAAQRLQSTVNDLKTELVNDLGMTEANANRFAKDMMDRANELHAAGLKFYGLEAATSTRTQVETGFQRELTQGIAEALPKPLLGKFAQWMNTEAQKGPIPHKVWVNKVGEMFREGYVTKEQLEAARKDAWLSGRGAKEKAGEVAGAASGASVQGRASNGATYRTKMEARTLHSQDKLTNSQMRAINANPNIPEM